MTSWQYFYKVYGDPKSDEERRVLGRSDADGPEYNSQMFVRPAHWVTSACLERYCLLGTNENDYAKTSEDRAIEIIGEWVASGRLTEWPDEPKRPGS